MYANQFIGRSEEKAALLTLLSSSRLVSLVGPPGVGKTRLIVELLPEIPGEKIFCSNTSDLSESLNKKIVSKKQALLVLDGCERDIATLRDKLSEIYKSAPNLRVVCTSREPIGLPFEAVSLLHPLTNDHAAILFIERAREQNVSVDASQLQALLPKLDGLPLVIELAAARTKLLSIPQLIEKLSSRFQLLPNLAGVLATSWEALTPHEQSALSQCALFRGSFRIEAAEKIIELSEGAPWIFDILQALCEKSLLSRHRERLSMLLSIKEWALAGREQSDGSQPQRGVISWPRTDIRGLWERFATYFLSEAMKHEAQLYGANGESSRRWFDEERENLLEVNHLGGALQNPQWSAESALYLARSFSGDARYESIVALLSDALAQHPEPLMRGALLEQRGRFFYLQGALQDALADLLAAHQAAQTNDELLARVCNRLGTYYLRTRELEQADTYLQQAATLFERCPPSRHRSGCSVVTAEQNAASSGVSPDSDAHPSRATHYHEYGFCESQRALLAKKRGQYQLAHKHYERSLALRQRIQDLPGVATSLLNISYFLKGQGRLAEARLYVEQVLPIAKRLSDKRLEASYIGALGAIHQEEGDLTRAVGLLEDSSRLLQDLGKKLLSSWFTLLLGQAYHELGRLTEARQQYEAVLSRRDSAEPAQESYTWSYLAAISAKEARWREADDALSLAERFAISAQEPVASQVQQVIKQYVASLYHKGSGYIRTDEQNAASKGVSPFSDARQLFFHHSQQQKKQDAPHESPLPASGLLPSAVSWDVRFALRLLRSLVFMADSLPNQSALLLWVDKDARWFEVAPAARVNMQQRKAPRLLLLALIAQHEKQIPLSVDALFAKGWPNESAHPDAARSRVYTALNLLRSLGLQDILLRRDDGYLLSKELVIKID